MKIVQPAKNKNNQETNLFKKKYHTSYKNLWKPRTTNIENYLLMLDLQLFPLNHITFNTSYFASFVLHSLALTLHYLKPLTQTSPFLGSFQIHVHLCPVSLVLRHQTTILTTFIFIPAGLPSLLCFPLLCLILTLSLSQRCSFSKISLKFNFSIF